MSAFLYFCLSVLLSVYLSTLSSSPPDPVDQQTSAGVQPKDPDVCAAHVHETFQEKQPGQQLTTPVDQRYTCLHHTSRVRVCFLHDEYSRL